jgi:hypothetical protein
MTTLTVNCSEEEQNSYRDFNAPNVENVLSRLEIGDKFTCYNKYKENQQQ